MQLYQLFGGIKLMLKQAELVHLPQIFQRQIHEAIMLALLRKENLRVFWLFFHVALGFVSVSTIWPAIIWYYLVFFSTFLSFFYTRKESSLRLIYLLAYSLGIEVFGRALKAYPYIPDQIGKYLGVILFLVGLALGGPIKRVSVYGAGMLLLSIPALIVTPYDSFKPIILNYFGPLALFLGVIFCSRQIMTFKAFNDMSVLMLYPIISLACFAYFNAAQIEKIEYGLTANNAAAGGGFTNQVATLFGLGVALIVLMYITRQTLFKYKVLDIAVLLLLLIRGLLTFSRGGMVTAIIAILIVMIFPKAKAAWQDSEIKLRNFSVSSILITFSIVFVVFLAINAYTGNYLLYRYQGKTERSIQSGFDKKTDLDQISSGRYKIMISDFEMFIDYPALGVGVGHSVKVREQYGAGSGFHPHLEFSRLLAEHGMPGLVLIVMIFIYPFYKIWHEPNNYRRSIMLLFMIVALASTFHSAMRTMVTPLLFAFAFINYVPTNFDWRAELAIQNKRILRKRKHNELILQQQQQD